MLFIAGIVAVVLLILLFITSYIKASPDEALIVSGLRKKPKIIIGKSGFRIPFLEKKDRLSLKLIPIDVKTSSSVPTADYININVDAVVNVKVSDDFEKINLAAQNFLNKDTEKIGAIAREVLEGNMREIVGQMTLEQMVSDRQTFAEKVKDNAAPDLAKMGLDIVSFNVQNFIDNNNVIEDLGVDNITKIRKKAAIAKAQSEKEIAVEQAKARKEANDAKIESDTQIAIKENALALKKSELDAKAGTEKAKADAAYKIQLEEQRKTLEITTANANIAKQEKEVEIRRKEVEVQEQTLDAQIKKQAEADKYAALQKADADLYTRQKEAEARAFELQKQAEAEAYQRQKKAEADKAAMENEATGKKALAEAVQAQGEAEAEAIKAKLVAEADGMREKAEALKEYGDAAKQQMQLDALKVYFEQLPKIAEAAGKAYQSVDKIYMYGGDSSKLQSDIMKNVTQVSEGLGQTMGIDLKTLLGAFVGSKLATNASKDGSDLGLPKTE
jgi:flotillin